ncbi:hypothetical protein BGX38DRAFT_619564 [Terfezia claveryi]|nr:hypothetical protein BGX38DRAFT_619564 [Terfezia claveryi]
MTGRYGIGLGRIVPLGNAALHFSLQVRGGGTIPAGAVIFRGYLFPILLLLTYCELLSRTTYPLKIYLYKVVYALCEGIGGLELM